MATNNLTSNSVKATFNDINRAFTRNLEFIQLLHGYDDVSKPLPEQIDPVLFESTA